MDRMNLTDASFLYGEDGLSHNDVGVVLTFDGPAPHREEVMQLIADRIALVPRFRQRVKHIPYAVALPVWVDDTNFDMGRHVFHHPAPPSADPLGSAVSQLMSVPMDLNVPLWQAHLISGLPEKRWALVMRLHHAMADGHDTVQIIQHMLSPDPAGQPPVLDTWHARPEPDDYTLVFKAVQDTLKDSFEMWTRLLTLGPGALPKLPETLDISAFTSSSLPLSPIVLNGPIRAGRGFSMGEVELARLRRLSKTLGGTVNDIVLTACAAGFGAVVRDYLGEQTDNRSIRAMVPVSLHSTQQVGVIGHNEIGAMVVELPIGPMPVAARLDRIRKQMQAFKTLKKAMPADAINPGATLGSPVTLMMASRMASSAPVFVNTVISNVPGPQTPLYLAGRRMHRLGACIALWNPLKTAISTMSYDGVVTVSVVTEDATFSVPGALTDAILAAVDDLDAAAAQLSDETLATTPAQ